MVGANITIPIDMSVLATIISITKNGTYNKNPIINALLSSLVTKAEIITVKSKSSGFSDSACSTPASIDMKQKMKQEIFINKEKPLSF